MKGFFQAMWEFRELLLRNRVILFLRKEMIKIGQLSALICGICGCSGPQSTIFKIAVDPTWYSLDLIGRQKNVLAFSIELLQEIAKQEHLNLSLVRMGSDNLLWGLKEKRYHAVLSTLTPYVFYQRKYSFSKPYLMTGPALVLPSKEKKFSLSEMQGKEIGIIKGSEAALLLQMYPGVLIRYYDLAPEALNALAQGHVDAVVLDVLLARSYVQDLFQGVLKIEGPLLNDQGLRLVTLYNEHTFLRRRFDKALKILKTNGKYDKLLSKWGLFGKEGPSEEVLNRQIELFLQPALQA